MTYVVSTQKFEGPFNLLLQLVEQDKVDIDVVDLNEITTQFLEEVREMQSLDLDVASDFVLVASTLASIKAASLASEDFHVDEDEEFDFDLDGHELQDILVTRLLAYKQCLNVADDLNKRYEKRSKLHERSAGPEQKYLEVIPDYLENVKLEDLAKSCAKLLMKREEFLLEADHIAPKRVPVANRIQEVTQEVRDKEKTSLWDLLGDEHVPDEVVVTLLALLELYNQAMVKLVQEEQFGDIDVMSTDLLYLASPIETDLESTRE